MEPFASRPVDGAESVPEVSVRRHTALLTLGTAAAGGAGVAALVLRDPHSNGSWGVCPLLEVTGLYCPGCGSLRGLHDLVVGNIGEAVSHNALLLPSLAWLLWWWFAQAAASTGRSMAGPPTSARFCHLLLLTLTVFTLARNLPASALAP